MEQKYGSLERAMGVDTISKNGACLKSNIGMGMFSRKMLLLGLLCLFGVVTLFAAKTITLKSGDVSVVKKPALAFFEIDFSNAKVGDETMEEYQKRRGDDFIRDWPEAVKRSYVFFTKNFNKTNKKGIQLTTDKDAINVSYRFVVTVYNLNMGDGWSGLTPIHKNKAGGMLMSGSIDIIDMENNTVVCSFKFENVKGLGHIRVRDRLDYWFMCFLLDFNSATK